MAKVIQDADHPFLDPSFALEKIPEEERQSIIAKAKACEAQYKKDTLSLWFILPICLVIGVVLTVFNPSPNPLIISVILGVILLGIIREAAKKKATQAFESEVMPKIVQAVFGEDAKFSDKEGWNKDYLEAYKLFDFGNIYESDTKISAKYKDVFFSVANVVSGQRSSNGKSSSTTYYFKGLVAVYEFHKDFKGSLEIREEEHGYGRSLVYKKTDKVEFEDIVFNEQFNVYAADKEAAFYVVTPQFIEAFKEIKKRVPGTLIFCIQSDRLIIAIEGASNVFSFASARKDGEAFVQKLIEEILPFRWFVDMFRLDDAYGKKAVERAIAQSASPSEKGQEEEQGIQEEADSSEDKKGDK